MCRSTSFSVIVYVPLQMHVDLRRREDLIQVAHGVVNHQSQNAHLSRSALVELDGTLLGLPLVALLVPAKVKAIAPIAGKLGIAGAVGHANLEDGTGSKDPKVVIEAHVPQGREAGGAALGAGEAVAGVCGEVSCVFVECELMIKSRPKVLVSEMK